jgi:glycine/D-amino acid oxidase-like deaminating enzyme
MEAKLTVSDSRITGVRVAEQVFDADIVVVAAGVGTNALTESAGVSLPIDSSPGFLVRFKTAGVLVNRILASPAREVRQLSEDILITPEFGIAVGPEAAAKRCLTQVQRMLTGAEAMRLDGIGIGWRPIPSDGLPIVGFAPQIEGLYVTVMHPGVNLAPAIGRWAAAEILDEVSVSLLDAFRPERFLDR